MTTQNKRDELRKILRKKPVVSTGDPLMNGFKFKRLSYCKSTYNTVRSTIPCTWNWGYKISHWDADENGVIVTVTVSRLRLWYEMLKLILFKMEIHIG